MATKMFKSIFEFKEEMSILALGPHADDIELGCGATLLYLKEHYQAKIHYVVFCDHFAKPVFLERRKEIEHSSKMLGCDSFESIWGQVFTF